MIARKCRQILPLCGLAFVLAGCSMADFAYDLAPRLAVRFMDDYLQLTNRQSEQALELFRERHALHARDELPRYYRFLVDTKAAVSDALTLEEVDVVFDSVRSLYRLGAERTIPLVAQILAGLDDDQLDALAERLADDAEEDREEMQENHSGRQLREALKDMEEWVGELSETQRRMVAEELAGMNETRVMWLEWRVANNERLLALLRTDPPVKAIEAFLSDYWIHRTTMPEALLERLESNRLRYRGTIVALDKSLSSQQRETVMEKLTEYTELVVDMMPDKVRVATLDAGAGGPDRQAAQ